MPAPLRHVELLAALSLATDLGMGQPLEFALQSCVVAMRLAENSSSLKAPNVPTALLQPD
ncbi:MAG: hypothetical protein JNL09_01800 [Anaerolineales bacterium]|nr:hypothetical protein [Anaerolineales bacterium]